METFALVTEAEGDDRVEDTQVKRAGIESGSFHEAVVTRSCHRVVST